MTKQRFCLIDSPAVYCFRTLRVVAKCSKVRSLTANFVLSAEPFDVSDFRVVCSNVLLVYGRVPAYFKYSVLGKASKMCPFNSHKYAGLTNYESVHCASWFA